MIKTATISSKRQLTIPVSIYDKLNLSNVRTMVVEENDNTLVLTPVQNVVDSLAGSVSIPPKYKNINIDEIIEKSKVEYFNKRRK